MAFNTEIQSSHSRPQSFNNNQVDNSANQINTNRVNETGTTKEASAYNYDNNKFRKVRKYNIDDPGTRTTRNYRNPSGQPIVTPDSSEQFKESEQQKSENVNTNTATEIETKNIFAYEAFENSTGSVGNSKNATPPPSENNNSDPGKHSKPNTVTEENFKDTLFTKVSSANVFSEKQYKPSTKERYNNCPSSDRSIYERKPQYGSKILPNSNAVSSNYTGTNKSKKTIVSSLNYFNGDQKQSKRQEYNTQEYSAENQSKRNESAINSSIDIDINGRYRVDRCRYVPFTSGYEWSNAAYCYS